MAGLLDFITEAAKKQYAQGAPYRQAVTGLLQGDTSKANTLLDRGIESLRTPEGAMDVALNFSPMMLGTFIGKNSKLWNSSKADIAQQLEKSGVSPEEIWRQTGTVRGVDGKLRQEISDANSIMNPIDANANLSLKSNNVISHQDLFKSYPDLAEIRVSKGRENYYSPEMNSIKLNKINKSLQNQSLYDAKANKIYADAEKLEKKGFLTPKKELELQNKLDRLDSNFNFGLEIGTFDKPAVLHELQHAIQLKEGFAKGGSPEGMRDVALDMLRRDVASGEIGSINQAMDMLPMAQQNAYRRLAGEAESRLTEARRDLSPAQRLQYFPYSQGQYGLDVPYESLIVRGLLE